MKIPPEAVYLEARGLIAFKSHHEGPAPAWSTWDERKRQFNVNVLDSVEEMLGEDEMTAILRHELAHIVLGHCHDVNKLNKDEEACHSQDINIAMDTAVNWWMPPAVQESIDTAFGMRSVWSVETLQSLGFDGKSYVPWQAVHDRVHEMADEFEQNGSGFCGGFEGDIPTKDQARAMAIGSILGSRIQNDKEASKQYGQMAGSNPGGMTLVSPPTPVPPWVSAVQDFARSIVRAVLADRRSHTRPQQALRAMGYHSPSLKPRWASVPDTVCLLVDTSGSMYNLLGQVMPAVEYLNQHDITVRLIAGDTVVTVDEEIRRYAEAPSLVGGGGTDIVPLFERASSYAPRAVVCFTDGFVSSWPSGEYENIETLWVCDLEAGVPYGRQVRT